MLLSRFLLLTESDGEITILAMNEAIRTYLETIGQRGGEARTPAKIKAVRHNLKAAWAARKAKAAERRQAAKDFSK